MLPSGRIAELTSAKWSMLVSVLLNVVCCAFSPPAAKFHYSGLFVMRLVQGLSGAISFPAMHVMLAHWAPAAERSIMTTVLYSGTSLGTVVRKKNLHINPRTH